MHTLFKRNIIIHSYSHAPAQNPNKLTQWPHHGPGCSPWYNATPATQQTGAGHPDDPHTYSFHSMPSTLQQLLYVYKRACVRVCECDIYI